jgi:hypothetical protein
MGSGHNFGHKLLPNLSHGPSCVDYVKTYPKVDAMLRLISTSFLHKVLAFQTRKLQTDSISKMSGTM